MQSFDPSGVRLGAGGGGGVYMQGLGGGLPTSGFNNPKGIQSTPQQNATLGAQAVRATGSGPFDQNYRQNLATYAGGLSQRPGGNLAFNPTGNIMGGPTGGGNAPVMGGPTDLLTAAMGGQGFAANTTAPVSLPTPTSKNPLSFWLNQFQTQGNPFRSTQ